jgi:hypothetical protein
MPNLNILIAPPDDWEEFVITNDEGISHRLQANGKLAPFRTKVVPEQPGWESILIDFVSTQQKQSPHIGVGIRGDAYASVPVDIAALAWIKEHWAKGRRIEIALYGDGNPGFTFGSDPDGGDVVWDQDVAKYLKLSQAALKVSGYKEGTETQAIEAPIPLAPIPPVLQASLGKIASRLDWLLGIVAIFAVYYWVHK